jgi:hypothetical protein
MFTSLFRANIRTLLNWDRMKKEEWPVAMFVVISRDQLSKLYLPWYVAFDNKETEYFDNESSPISLGQLPSMLNYLGKERKRYIRKLAVSFRRSTSPVQLIVPAYAVAEDVHMLLDGNHRAAALMDANVDFRMVVFSILGPLDSDALPDLTRWQS